MNMMSASRRNGEKSHNGNAGLAVDVALSRKIRSIYDVAKTVVSKINNINEQKKLILVADDEPLMFQLISEFLSEANIRCDLVTASNGYEAIKIAFELVPDLIIADWLMPGSDGLELTRSLKINPATRDIPVILVTGVLVTQEQLNEFFEAGAVDFIRKPIDYSELRARVKTALVLDEAIKETKTSRESFFINDQILNYVVDAPIMIFYLDESGRLLGCNSAFEAFVGFSKEKFILHSFEEFLPKSVADILEINFSNLPHQGISLEFDAKCVSENGHQRQLTISLTRFGDPLNSLIVGTITDITKVMVASNLEKELITSNIEKLQADLDYKQRELAVHMQLLIHSKTVKQELLDGVNKLLPYLNLEGKSKFFGLVKQLQRQMNEETLITIEKKFDELHGCLYRSLERCCPDITKNEKRLCAYLRMNHSAADIAKITNRSLNSINVGFARLRSKLNLPSNKNLKVFLRELATPLNQPIETTI